MVLLYQNSRPLLYCKLYLHLLGLPKEPAVKVWLTYGGLLEENSGVGSSQGIDGRHVDLVREGRENLWEEDATAVLVVRILGGLQRLLVVSGGKTGEKKTVRGLQAV